MEVHNDAIMKINSLDSIMLNVCNYFIGTLSQKCSEIAGALIKQTLTEVDHVAAVCMSAPGDGNMRVLEFVNACIKAVQAEGREAVAKVLRENAIRSGSDHSPCVASSNSSDSNSRLNLRTSAIKVGQTNAFTKPSLSQPRRPFSDTPVSRLVPSLSDMNFGSVAPSKPKTSTGCRNLKPVETSSSSRMKTLKTVFESNGALSGHSNMNSNSSQIDQSALNHGGPLTTLQTVSDMVVDTCESAKPSNGDQVAMDEKSESQSVGVYHGRQVTTAHTVSDMVVDKCEFAKPSDGGLVAMETDSAASDCGAPMDLGLTEAGGQLGSSGSQPSGLPACFRLEMDTVMTTSSISSDVITPGIIPENLTDLVNSDSERQSQSKTAKNEDGEAAQPRAISGSFMAGSRYKPTSSGSSASVPRRKLPNVGQKRRISPVQSPSARPESNAKAARSIKPRRHTLGPRSLGALFAEATGTVIPKPSKQTTSSVISATAPSPALTSRTPRPRTRTMGLRTPRASIGSLAELRALAEKQKQAEEKEAMAKEVKFVHPRTTTTFRRPSVVRTPGATPRVLTRPGRTSAPPMPPVAQSNTRTAAEGPPARKSASRRRSTTPTGRRRAGSSSTRASLPLRRALTQSVDLAPGTMNAMADEGRSRSSRKPKPSRKSPRSIGSKLDRRKREEKTRVASLSARIDLKQTRAADVRANLSACQESKRKEREQRRAEAANRRSGGLPTPLPPLSPPSARSVDTSSSDRSRCGEFSPRPSSVASEPIYPSSRGYPTLEGVDDRQFEYKTVFTPGRTIPR
eukprot:882288_1